MNFFVQRLSKKILTFLQVQCFLTLASLPVLVAWGLPISYLSIIGNALFVPYIFAFLVCSSFIFFTEFFHIPNGYLCTILEWISSSWFTLLSYGSSSWLFALPLSILPLLIGISLLSFIVVCYIKLQKPTWFLLYSLLCILIIKGATLYVSVPERITITCKKKCIELVKTPQGITLLDHGGLGEKRNQESWIYYTIMPELARQFGATTINTVLYRSYSYATRKALETLCKENRVQHIAPYNKNI